MGVKEKVLVRVLWEWNGAMAMVWNSAMAVGSAGAKVLHARLVVCGTARWPWAAREQKCCTQG
jgi:hypothetical protein